MPAADNIIQALMALLTGGASIPTGVAAGQSPSAVSPAAAAPMPVPVPVPVEQQRPATLPGGSFVPAQTRAKEAIAAPDSMPQADQPSAPAAAPPQSHSILEQLFGGNEGGGGHSFRDFVRAAGGGMANMTRTGGDPYLAFSQGFGGAAGYRDTQDQQAAAAATAAEKLGYDRSQDAGKTEREIQKDRADQALKVLAEERQQKTADLANQKTAVEIRRLARQHGVTTSEMIAIENAALKAGDNEPNPTKRKATIDAARADLLRRVQEGDGSAGLSDPGAGLSGEGEMTATNPDTGERMKLVDGAWVPM